MGPDTKVVICILLVQYTKLILSIPSFSPFSLDLLLTFTARFCDIMGMFCCKCIPLILQKNRDDNRRKELKLQKCCFGMF